MVLFYCNHDVTNASFDLMKFIQDIGPIIISIVALVLSYFITKKTLSVQKEQTRKTLDEQKNVEARLMIRRKLDEFYGPLIQLRKESNLLYSKLVKEKKKERVHFSTLKYLLDGSKFCGNDEVILKEIIRIGKESESLIHSKAGLIDDAELRQNLLPKATMHFLLLRLAYSGAIKGDSGSFVDLSFPKELDDRLEQRKIKLEEKLNELNKSVDK